MNKTATSSKPRKRTAPKEQRRLQLIKATMRSIARRGLSDTTMATVASLAGLSQGIINLHFKSKERLLVETLRYVTDDYRQAWERALENAGPASADKLTALIDVDFEKAVCDRNKLAVWFAFWGESKSRPTYRKLCTERDEEYLRVLTGLCQDLIDGGGFTGLDAEIIASGLSAMSEGLWLDLLLTPETMNPERARDICLTHMASIFPGYFTE